MLRYLIQKLVEEEDLSEREMTGAMEVIMTGEASEAQVGAFLTAFRLKGETVDEIVGAARVIRRHAAPVGAPRSKPAAESAPASLVDTCGTGGDAGHTFNISTAAAFVLAGAGVRVAKHGNRAVSSRCGSADVLQSLGVNLDVEVDTIGDCIDEIGIGFLYAPHLHSAMRHVAPIRREIGIRTVFNLLGPLTNPADVDCQVVGVCRRELTGILASALARLGSRRAMVVHGSDGLDEITTTGPTHVAELQDGSIREYDIRPEDAGLPSAHAHSLRGGDAAVNAEIVRLVLDGARGPQRDIVILNAAGALTVAGEAQDLKEGVEVAAASIDSGRARAKLAELIEKTNRPPTAPPRGAASGSFAGLAGCGADAFLAGEAPLTAPDTGAILRRPTEG
jgi:anthranilate phosphoribosyltransferase